MPGEISTPEFPDGSLDTSCTWKIQAPENVRLEITIKDLKLTGVDDHLIIRDGAEATSPLIGKYGPCASGSLTLFSSGNFAFLQMVSSVFMVNDKLRVTFRPTGPGKRNTGNLSSSYWSSHRMRGHFFLILSFSLNLLINFAFGLTWTRPCNKLEFSLRPSEDQEEFKL